MSLQENKETKLPPYILLSPVGYTRQQYFNAWFESAKALKPPPDEIIICVDYDNVGFIPPDDIKVLYSPTIENYRGSLERIENAREILRRYFIKSGYEFALWLDSDITTPPNIISVLNTIWHEKEVWLVVNKYQGRGDYDSRWCGSGVMWMHVNAALMSRFWVGEITTPDGKIKNLSEDYIFFAIFDQGRYFCKQWSGRDGRCCDEYVKVNHIGVNIQILLEKKMIEERTP